MTKTYKDLLNKLKNMNESQTHIEHVNKKGFSLYILRTCKDYLQVRSKGCIFLLFM